MASHIRTPVRKSGRLLTSTMLAILAVNGGRAGGQETGEGWTFTSTPLASLWFHGLAQVDPFGPGPNPLYDLAYPGEIRREKAEAEAGSTALDRRTGYFRDAFRRDPAFEILHFLPLYFAQAGRSEVFSALQILANSREGIPRGLPPRTAFGVAAVGSFLTTPAQRRILGEFSQALQEEWAAFYQGYWQRTEGQRQAAQQSLRVVWANEFQPALASSLQSMGFAGGSVVLARSLGPEGRIFTGTPQEASDNIVVVSTPREPQQAPEAIFALLKELSFPTVRRVMARVDGGSASPTQEEKVAADAAVRVGALLLGRFLPDRLQDYQRFFLSQVAPASPPGPSGSAVAAAFQEAYPLASSLEAVLKEEVLSTNQDGDRE